MPKKNKKLIGFLNSFSQGKSGGDSVFIEILKRIKNYDKTIITSGLGKKMCLDCGLDADYLITTKEKKFSWTIFTYLKRIFYSLFLTIKAEKNDVLLGSSDFLPDVFPIFILKLKYSRNIWVQHIFHIIPTRRKLSSFAQKLSFILIKSKANIIITDNKILKDELVKLGICSDKIFVNYPGLDHSYLKKVKNNNYPKRYDGVFMAQLRKSKGIFDLIEIWKKTCSSIKNARLAVIGKGSDNIVKELKRRIEIYGLDHNIEVFGYLPEFKAYKIITESRIFIFPSYEEGFGIAPLESQALGLPVIAWDLPVFKEIFPQGMIRIQEKNMDYFVEEIVRLLEDKKYYEKISYAAFMNSRKYNWDTMAKKEHSLMTYGANI